MSISFVAVIFLLMPKACCSSYTRAFKIKVSAEAGAVENNLEIPRDYGLSESMVGCWRRDQATILSGKVKMSAKCAKMGCFTPKYPELDKQVREWFSWQSDQIFHLKCKMRRVLPNWVRSSFNAWGAKNLIGGQSRDTLLSWQF